MPEPKAASESAENSPGPNHKSAGGVGKDEAVRVPTVPEASAKPELSPEERWKQFDDIMAKLRSELTLLSQEAAFQTLLVCPHLEQEKFDKYLNTLLTEQVSEVKEEEDASPGNGIMASVSNVFSSSVGAITRRLSSTGPTKSDLKQSLQRLYAFLMEVKHPDIPANLDKFQMRSRKGEAKKVFNQVKNNVVLEAVKVLRLDSKIFSDVGVLPQTKDTYQRILKSVQEQAKRDVGQYVVDKEKELRIFLRTHGASVKDVFKVAEHFKENTIEKDPLQTLQILLEKTQYSPQKLVKHVGLLTHLAEQCDQLGRFFSPHVIILDKLEKHVPGRLNDLCLYSSKMETLVFEKRLLLDSILNLSDEDFKRVLDWGVYFETIPEESFAKCLPEITNNWNLMDYLCGLDEEVKSVLASHRYDVLSYMKRYRTNLRDLTQMTDFKQRIDCEVKEIRWPTLVKKSAELLEHPAFDSAERVLVLIALIRTAAAKKRQDKTNDKCFEALLDQFKANKVAAIEAETQKAKTERGGLWGASLRKDPLDMEKTKKIEALKLNIQAFNLIVSEIFSIFEQSDYKTCEGMSAYLQIRCVKFAKGSKLDKSKLKDDLEVFPGLKEDFSLIEDQAELFPDVVLAQDEEFLFFIRETPLSPKTLMSFLKKLDKNNPILSNVRLLQSIHETMGYSYDELVANSGITTFIAEHFEVFSGWLKREKFPLGSLVNLVALDSIAEVTDEELRHLLTLDESPILPLSVVLNQSASYIRMIAREKFVGAVKEIWEDFSNSIPRESGNFREAERDKWIKRELNKSRQYDPESGGVIQSEKLTLLTLPEGVFSLVEEGHINVRQLLSLTKEQAGFLCAHKETIIPLSQSVGKTVFDMMCSYKSLAYVVAVLRNNQRFDRGTKEHDVLWCLEPTQQFLLHYVYHNLSLPYDSPFFQEKLPWIQENRDKLEDFIKVAYQGVKIAKFFDHTPSMRALFMEHPPVDRGESDVRDNNYANFCRALWDKGSAGNHENAVLQDPFYLSEGKHWVYKEPRVILDLMKQGVSWESIEALSENSLHLINKMPQLILYLMKQGVSWRSIEALSDNVLDQISRMPQVILYLVGQDVSWESIEALSENSLAWIGRAVPKSNMLASQLRKEKDLNDPKAIAILESLMGSLVKAIPSGEQEVKAVLRANRACRQQFRAHPVRWGVLSGGMAALAVLTPLVSSWLLPTFVLSADALSTLPSGLLLGLGITVAVLAVAAAVYTAKKTHDHCCRSALFKGSASTNCDFVNDSFDPSAS